MKIQASWRYRKLRRRLLAAEPLCRLCAAEGRTVAAAELDHMEPVAQRPDLAWEPRNLRPLCKEHHLARHGAQPESPAQAAWRQRVEVLSR